MKVPVNSIRAGNVVEYNGKLWVASKVQHINPGKGGAFVALELHLPCMSGKGLARLALLVFTALLGAGLTFGAMNAPMLASVATQAAAQPSP